MSAAILVALLSLAQPVHAEPVVSVGTGMGPMGLDGGGILGGTLRLGYDLGALRPFVGGNWSQGTITLKDEDGDERDKQKGNLWSAVAGARLAFATDGDAFPYLIGGAHLLHASAEIWEDEFTFTNGFGAFGGLGADAHLSEVVDLGVEVVYLRSFGSEIVVDDEEITGHLGWVYSDIHLTIRFGRDS